MDAALLLVAGNEQCPQPQTAEHLAAVEIMKLQVRACCLRLPALTFAFGFSDAARSRAGFLPAGTPAAGGGERAALGRSGWPCKLTDMTPTPRAEHHHSAEQDRPRQRAGCPPAGVAETDNQIDRQSVSQIDR